MSICKVVVISLLGLCSFTLSLSAQDQKASIELENRDEFLDAQDRGNQGIVIKTGRTDLMTKALNWQLHVYDERLNLLHRVPIAKDQINKGFDNVLITSQQFPWMYHLEYKGYNTTFPGSKRFITQVAPDGKTRTLEINEKKDVEGEVAVRFVGKDGFYLLTVPEEEDGKQMYLYCLGHEDLKLRKPIKMAPLADASSYFAYTLRDGLLYFVKLDFEHKERVFDGEIVAYDLAGDIQRQISFQLSFSPDVYPQRAEYPWWKDDPDLDHVSPSFGTIYQVGLHLDTKHERIYAYGLYGARKSGNYGSTDGYFVQSFDFTGTALQKLEQPWDRRVREDKAMTGTAVGNNDVSIIRRVYLEPKPGKAGQFFSLSMFCYRFSKLTRSEGAHFVAEVAMDDLNQSALQVIGEDEPGYYHSAYQKVPEVMYPSAGRKLRNYIDLEYGAQSRMERKLGIPYQAYPVNEGIIAVFPNRGDKKDRIDVIRMDE